MVYPRNTIYIIGNSKAPQNNPITHMYSMFFIGLVIEKDTGRIIDAGASGVLPMTSEFIKSIFINKNIESDISEFSKEIESRYFGSSQKALIVAFKDAQKKYFQIKSGKNVEE